MDNNILTKEEVIQQVQGKDYSKLFQALQPECIAIYLGGSICQNYLETYHDIDFICFTTSDQAAARLKAKLTFINFLDKSLEESGQCWKQVRNINSDMPYIFSYIDRDMIWLCGQHLSFTYDLLGVGRPAYVKKIKSYLRHLHNPKRYYHLYRGLLILQKNSYDLTEQEIVKLNMLHQQKSEDYLQIQELCEQIRTDIRSLRI